MFERRHQAPVHDSPILLGDTGRCSGNLVCGKTGKTTPVHTRPSERSLSPALAPRCRRSSFGIASGTLGIVAMADNPIRLILTLGFTCAEIVNIRRSHVEIRSLSAGRTHFRTRSELQHRAHSRSRLRPAALAGCRLRSCTRTAVPPSPSTPPKPRGGDPDQTVCRKRARLTIRAIRFRGDRGSTGAISRTSRPAGDDRGSSRRMKTP